VPRLVGPTMPGISTTTRDRGLPFALVLFFLALAVITFPSRPAAAAGVKTQGPGELCSIEQWQADIARCLGRLPEVAGNRAQCLKAPTPDAPDSGLAGWFATRPDASKVSGIAGRYTDYGYAGYAYTTYDIGCAPTLMHPDYKFENTVANGEFMLATAVIGASNALRERAWDPGMMWGWADPLVEKATRSIYARVFTVFGGVTLAVVGLYLLWRSRQAHMSAAMTTVGWALLVMVTVTALAKWPVFSAHLADNALVSSLAVVHDAVGPPTKDIPANECPFPDPAACRDTRPPAIRASDTAVDTMLYKNWLRGLLGSADSPTAQKYGPALYDARSLTWDEAAQIRLDARTRDTVIQRKSEQWMRVAEQIRTEDPEAYQYITGIKGMDRIGAGFIALLASTMFALFDLTASLLVLLGFLIFRWAVIAAPVLGTVGLLRPASAGFRRLANAVVAALFNIVIFGTGAAIYLFAVDLIMNTTTLPGWLQVVLVWLCGVVGWLLLRPYRRITQLGGRDATAAIASAGSWHRRFFRDIRDIRETAPVAGTRPRRDSVVIVSDRPPQRIELRTELRSDGAVQVDTGVSDQPSQVPRRRMPVPSGDGWSEPSTETQPSYALYRPRRSTVTTSEEAPSSRAPARAESRGEM
jgi:hypothetical protein